jgi:hypothetical protein
LQCVGRSSKFLVCAMQPSVTHLASFGLPSGVAAGTGPRNCQQFLLGPHARRYVGLCQGLPSGIRAPLLNFLPCSAGHQRRGSREESCHCSPRRRRGPRRLEFRWLPDLATQQGQKLNNKNIQSCWYERTSVRAHVRTCVFLRLLDPSTEACPWSGFGLCLQRLRPLLAAACRGHYEIVVIVPRSLVRTPQMEAPCEGRF